MAIQHNDAVNTTDVPAVKQSGERKQNLIKHFLKEVMVELKKTDWPSKNELTKSSVVVIVTMASVALYLFISDTIAMHLTRILFGIGKSSGM